MGSRVIIITSSVGKGRERLQIQLRWCLNYKTILPEEKDVCGEKFCTELYSLALLLLYCMGVRVNYSPVDTFVRLLRSHFQITLGNSYTCVDVEQHEHEHVR